MTLEDLKKLFRDNLLTPNEALQEAAPFLRNAKTKQQAEAFIGEVLGMPAEPSSMTDDELGVAKRWEKNYRGKR